jgi:betaine reductase
LSVLEGKKVIVLGERDGIAAPAIAACVRAARGEVVLAITECFA